MPRADFRYRIVQFSDRIRFQIESRNNGFIGLPTRILAESPSQKRGLFVACRSRTDLSMPRKGMTVGRCDGKSGWAVVSSGDV